MSGIRNFRFLALHDIGASVWRSLCDARISLAVLRGRARRITAFADTDTILLTYVPARRSFRHSMERAKGKALAAGLVYDLIPLHHPHLFWRGFTENFQRGLNEQIAASDLLIGISRATALALERHLEEEDSQRPVTHVYLGCDFSIAKRGAPERPRRERGSALEILSVGTLEPRKNYFYALDLCEALWAAGHDFRYTIVGGRGWRWKPLLRKISRHPEFGKRLLLRSEIDDETLQQLYQRSDILLATSIDEGFGLPLMEAANAGLEVICSDIPIFRELLADAHFVPLGDKKAAIARMEQAFLDIRAGRRRAAARAACLSSWEECVDAVMARILSLRGTAGLKPDLASAAE
jgi:alpha-1,2-rhamnosyltransferase